MTIPLKYNFRSLLQRKVRAALTILGIAAVVAVFVAMVALTRGMAARFAAVGSPDNLVVLQKGAFNQSLSSIPASSRNVIPYLPHIAKKGDVMLVSPEIFIDPWVSAPGLTEDAFMAVRGIEQIYFDVENTIRITAGTRELKGNGVLVGKAALQNLGGVGVGDVIGMLGEKWIVKGVFEAKGTFLETVLLADLKDVMRAANREEYSAYTLKLDSPSVTDAAIGLLEADRRVLVSASREPDYYATSGKPYAVVSQIGLLIALIVTFGAVFGGMNTMYTAVAGRMREIGTLRSLGFSRTSILLSFLFESIILSFSGGLLGAALGSLVTGLRINVGPNNLPFTVGPEVILSGIMLSLIVGFVGGLLPARAAARLTIVEAMRRG
jgi:ABC-type antimicrobial peptide transport system permease subunit